jgi:hypothetical protein
MTPAGSFPPTRAFQWDLARQVERLDVLLRLLPRYAAWGYQELYLHLEDAVEYPSLPGVARADAYSRRQFARLVEAATRAGLKVVPIINLLGHTQYLVKTPALRDLNERRTSGDEPLAHGQICPLHPRTLEIAEKLLRDMAPFCTAGKGHVGLDESFHLGRCPRCRAEIAQIGLAGHFAGHVNRLHALAGGFGLKLGLWADLLYYLPKAIPLLPRDVTAYEWYYYPFGRRPRVELYNFAEADLAAPLRRHGLAFYACPMNGAFRWEPLPAFAERMANITAWWHRGRRTGAAGFLVTSWEPGRLAFELTTAIDAAAACLWLDPDLTDPREMLARGFARVFGGNGRAAARLALAADRHPSAGYYRWQSHARWDTLLTREPAGGSIREEHALRQLCRRAHGHGTGCPPALRASLDFRLFLAQRDAFIRRSGQAVLTLRRAPGARQARLLQVLERDAAAFARMLIAARRAARAMWRRTRDPAVRGPNERLLERDGARLRAWRTWLRRVQQRPARVWQASPFGGKWQLQFKVWNFAPCLQKVIVEQQDAGGTWEILHELFTIEFAAMAARPRTRIVHEFSAPVDSPGALLRLALRGLGQVKVSDAVLTNGVTTLRAPDRRWRTLGSPAPRSGFPRPDWDANAGELELVWSRASIAL